MSEDLFGKTNQPVLDPDKDYFAELVGENAKFKTPQALARGKMESDLHISHLESELNELRQELTKARTVQDLMDQLEAKQKARQPDNQNGNQSEDGNPPADPLHKPNLSKEDVVSILRQEQEAAAQNRNVEIVKQALEQAWGASYRTELQKAAAEVGVSIPFLEDMAKKNPQAFLKLVGATDTSKREQEKSIFSPLGTSVNTQSQKPTGGEKDYAYYEKMRKDNPTLYFSPAIQKERWEQAKKLGEKF